MRAVSMSLVAVLGATCAGLGPTEGRAQDIARAPVVVVVTGDAGAEEAERVEAQLEALADRRGRVVARTPTFGAAAEGTGEASAADVEALSALESGLERAQSLSARLRELEALALLARMREALETRLHVPGASRWAAEIDLATALVAHQAGLAALADHRLRSATTLDASRRLGSAEAPPELVARARAIAREVAGGPRGAFTVRTDAVGAQVYLDDVLVGPSPARVEAPVGVHVLRVTGAGRVPHARRIEVLAGSRPEYAVRLAPDARAQIAHGLVAAAARGDLEGALMGLRALEQRGTPLELWLALASTEARGAWVARCDARGCEAARPLGEGRLAFRADGPPDGDTGGSGWGADPFERARAQLAASPGSDPETEQDGGPRASSRRARRALLWGSIGAAVTAGIAVSVLATRSGPAPVLVTTIDFGQLARVRR